MKFNAISIVLGLSLLLAPCFGQDNSAGETAPSASSETHAEPSPKPMSAQPLLAFEELGASFALSARIGDLQWSEDQFNAFVTGLSAAYHHHHEPFDESAKELYTAMAERIQEMDREKVEAQFTDPKFVEVFVRKTRRALNMQETDSGLCYMVQGAGGANRATAADTVVISFDVTASDLTTSLPKLSGARLRVKVSDLMPGLAEGVQMMTADSKAVFLLPPKLSYGDGKWPEGVAKNEPLIFRVTLHEVDTAGTPAPSS